MVTANLNHERRPSSDIGSEDDENSSRQIQNRLVSFSYFLFLYFSYFDIDNKKKLTESGKQNDSSPLLNFYVFLFMK